MQTLWNHPGFLTLLLFAPAVAVVAGTPSAQNRPSTVVKPTEDFEVTGDGSHASWQKAEWVPLRERPPVAHPYKARFKVLYSKTGVYFLMDGTDSKLTTTMKEDFLNLWTEDVFEVFLWPDEGHPVYFEYEISPMNYELPRLANARGIAKRRRRVLGRRAQRRAPQAPPSYRPPTA